MDLCEGPRDWCETVVWKLARTFSDPRIHRCYSLGAVIGYTSSFRVPNLQDEYLR